MNKLSNRIIGAVIEVHKALGPGKLCDLGVLAVRRDGGKACRKMM
ncbi:MAG: hypothetical protein V3W43_13235 [Desulfatiglandaceae bacterium]|jgi:hypothetical protein